MQKSAITSGTTQYVKLDIDFPCPKRVISFEKQELKLNASK